MRPESTLAAVIARHTGQPLPAIEATLDGAGVTAGAACEANSVSAAATDRKSNASVVQRGPYAKEQNELGEASSDSMSGRIAAPMDFVPRDPGDDGHAHRLS